MNKLTDYPTKEIMFNIVWSNTHRDYRGKFEACNTKNIMVLVNGGSTLVTAKNIDMDTLIKKYELAEKKQAKKYRVTRAENSENLRNDLLIAYNFEFYYPKKRIWIKLKNLDMKTNLLRIVALDQKKLNTEINL